MALLRMYMYNKDAANAAVQVSCRLCPTLLKPKLTYPPLYGRGLLRYGLLFPAVTARRCMSLPYRWVMRRGQTELTRDRSALTIDNHSQKSYEKVLH